MNSYIISISQERWSIQSVRTCTTSINDSTRIHIILIHYFCLTKKDDLYNSVRTHILLLLLKFLYTNSYNSVRTHILLLLLILIHRWKIVDYFFVWQLKLYFDTQMEKNRLLLCMIIKIHMNVSSMWAL